MIGKKNIKKNVSELLINYLKYFRSFYKAACIHRRQSLDQKKWNEFFSVWCCSWVINTWNRSMSGNSLQGSVSFLSCDNSQSSPTERLYVQNISPCKPDILWFAMSERPSMCFNKFQKSFQKRGNLWVKRQRSSPYWERKRIGIRRRSNLHPILRHEGNQKSLDKRRRKKCYWFHEIFVFHSWYLSHKTFIYRRQMWKISISHIFLWMFLSFGL